jgi:hypothetical protein
MEERTISKKKILDHIEEMMDANYNAIENGSDGDGNCEQENETLDNIRFFINSGMYE